MFIKFKSLKFKNVLSYGNAMTEYNFESGIDIITASNGSGKSALLDALTYVLFGKPYRKIKLGNLINNKNNKELYTELLFDIDEISYIIKRGMKPNIFEIYKLVDEEYILINQDSTIKDYQNILETEILMINEIVFRQLIVLGANVSNSKNFMDLNATEKEEVFQVITDTSLFKHLNDLIKNKRNEIKTILAEYKYQFDILSSTIENERKNIIAMQKQNDFLKQNKEVRINELNIYINENEKKLKEYDRAIIKLKDLKLTFEENIVKLNDMKSKIKTIKKEVDILEGKIKTFEHLKNASVQCDNCNHIILPKEYNLEEHINSQTRIKYLKQELNTINNEFDILEEKNNKIKETLLNSKRINQNRLDLLNNLEIKKKELKDIQEWKLVEIDSSFIEQKEKDLKEVKTIISNAESKLAALNMLIKIIGGDNLKGYILSKQIPLLNKYINLFIEKFSDFNFNFVIDNNFKEQFISRNGSQEFHSFSNGQKQRFTFAILFAFLKLIEERSGVSTNLLALDEILDSSADSSGRAELLDILYSNFADTKNIIIISHQPEVKERFEIINRIFEVQNNGFSKMIEVTS